MPGIIFISVWAEGWKAIIIQLTDKKTIGISMYQITDEEFEQVIEETLKEMPAEFIDALENICIVAEDEPSPSDLMSVQRRNNPNGPTGITRRGELLGLYHGINIQKRGTHYAMVEPDMITIFKGPHERVSTSREDIFERISKTVIHEIGHYFGLDDKRLREMGY